MGCEVIDCGGLAHTLVGAARLCALARTLPSSLTLASHISLCASSYIKWRVSISGCLIDVITVRSIAQYLNSQEVLRKQWLLLLCFYWGITKSTSTCQDSRYIV